MEHFRRLEVVRYQCSRKSTSEEISDILEKAKARQEEYDLHGMSRCVCEYQLVQTFSLIIDFDRLDPEFHFLFLNLTVCITRGARGEREREREAEVTLSLSAEICDEFTFSLARNLNSSFNFIYDTGLAMNSHFQFAKQIPLFIPPEMVRESTEESKIINQLACMATASFFPSKKGIKLIPKTIGNGDCVRLLAVINTT